MSLPQLSGTVGTMMIVMRKWNKIKTTLVDLVSVCVQVNNKAQDDKKTVKNAESHNN